MEVVPRDPGGARQHGQNAQAGGADGYILKTTCPGDLVEAIMRVAQVEGALDPAAAQAVVRQTQC